LDLRRQLGRPGRMYPPTNPALDTANPSFAAYRREILTNFKIRPPGTFAGGSDCGRVLFI